MWIQVVTQVEFYRKDPTNKQKKNRSPRCVRKMTMEAKAISMIEESSVIITFGWLVDRVGVGFPTKTICIVLNFVFVLGRGERRLLQDMTVCFFPFFLRERVCWKIKFYFTSVYRNSK